jgi:segregation and condensation protein B
MAELKKPSVKSKVEAVLFSIGHKITLDGISRLCRAKKEDALAALRELRQEYEAKQSSIMLVEEGENWKFTVRDHLVSVVRKIVTETELTRSVMETLAVIAFKYPILQSDLIKMRTNKAYDHLAELEKAGYITRQKHSRTNLIKLTEKFFRYFDLTEEKLKDQFKDFESIATAIREKEVEVDKIKGDQLKRAQDLKQEDEKIKQEIESLDDAGEEYSIPVATYDAQKSNDAVNPEKAKLMGNLEVVSVPKQKQRHEESESPIAANDTIPKIGDALQQNNIQKNQKNSQAAENQPLDNPQTESGMKNEHKKRKSKGIKTTPDMEKKIDRRVEEIVGGKDKIKEEDKNEKTDNEKEDLQHPVDSK